MALREWGVTRNGSLVTGTRERTMTSAVVQQQTGRRLPS
jgi:hypothetical protein